jgi:DNA (cytosine-5)-methyltransferase 1
MYTGINLFCGAGGMALGFHQAGGQVILGVDSDPNAIKSFHMGPARLADMREVTDLPQANVVFASLPGAGLSQLNPYARGRDHGDPRNLLLYEMIRLSVDLSPDAVILDGIDALFASPLFQEARRVLQDNGYHTAAAKLDAADYGVPQHRKHTVLIALRHGEPTFPLPTHHRKVTVRDAIGDLPLNDADQDFAFPRKPKLISLERYKVIGPDDNWQTLVERRPDLAPACWLRKKGGSTDVFGRLWWDRPAVTIRTEFYKPEKGRYLHPEVDRPITHREAARLQTFPDWYRIEGNQVAAGKLIGNAVPPLFAEQIARGVIRSLARAGVSPKG